MVQTHIDKPVDVNFSQPPLIGSNLRYWGSRDFHDDDLHQTTANTPAQLDCVSFNLIQHENCRMTTCYANYLDVYASSKW